MLYLDINLDQIPVDADLIRRVPYGLATYYLALPLARENGRVSVVMAHPENQAAVHVLHRLLQAEIVPLKGAVGAIQSALSRLYPAPQPVHQRVLAWSDDPTWETAVSTTATLFGQALTTPLEILPTGSSGADQLRAQAQTGCYSLAVLHMTPPLNDMLGRSATPLLLVRGPYQPVRRILLAMRGYTSDDRVLDWIVPLAQQQQTSLILMPLVDSHALDIRKYIRPDNPAGQHLQLCVHHLQQAGVETTLKLRQGPPIHQVVEELAQESYDLLVIAAEARGDFVRQILDALSAQQVHVGRPIFILRPPTMITA